MAKPNIVKGQTDISDMMLAMNETDTFILITLNGDDVSVFSTLESGPDAASYLRAAAKAVSHG